MNLSGDTAVWHILSFFAQMHAALLQTWHAFHPGLLCFQVRMDGSDGQTDLRMSMPQNVGAFYRESTKPDGSALCLGEHLHGCCLCTFFYMHQSALCVVYQGQLTCKNALRKAHICKQVSTPADRLEHELWSILRMLP